MPSQGPLTIGDDCVRGKELACARGVDIPRLIFLSKESALKASVIPERLLVFVVVRNSRVLMSHYVPRMACQTRQRAHG